VVEDMVPPVSQTRTRAFAVRATVAAVKV